MTTIAGAHVVPREPARLPELAAADRGVASSLEAVLSHNTRRTYNTQWRLFDDWCAEVGLVSLPGEERPAVVHPAPDPAAIALCRELGAQTDVEAVVLFGSRAAGSWDEQSDLDLIIIHDGTDDDDRRNALGQDLAELKERHYPGHRDYHSPHHGVTDGLRIEALQNYHAHRRTLNHVLARAAREGRVFTRDPGDADAFRHDGDTSNEWELVTLERFRRASEEARDLDYVRRSWLDRSRRSPVLNAVRGRNAHGLFWNSGAALLSILGIIYPRDSVAETAAAIARHDAGWSHAFRSDLAQIDQYAYCGCEVVVTDPIDDVPAMWRHLEIDRDALWECIRQLGGYDLHATGESPAPGP